MLKPSRMCLILFFMISWFIFPVLFLMGPETSGMISYHTAALLQAARDQRIITALEHDTLRALYLNSDVFSPSTAARTLNANVSAVERRAQRAIRKLCHHYEAAVAA